MPKKKLKNGDELYEHHTTDEITVRSKIWKRHIYHKVDPDTGACLNNGLNRIMRFEPTDKPAPTKSEKSSRTKSKETIRQYLKRRYKNKPK